MHLLDHETHILINENDWKQGFFRFSTTRLTDFNRLCRIVGGEAKLRSFRTNSHKGRIVEWICEVPSEFIGKSNWKIGRKRISNMTDTQKAAVKERFAQSRTRRTPKT